MPGDGVRRVDWCKNPPIFGMSDVRGDRLDRERSPRDLVEEFKCDIPSAEVIDGTGRHIFHGPSGASHPRGA
eukprot:6500719-Heterocapsa_arctica.AAC.1